MALLVGIPWRPQSDRDEAHRIVRERYKEWLPNAAIVDIDTVHQPFCLAACRNRTVHLAEKGGARIVVIGDADTIPEREPLLAAIEACQTSGLVHLPYTEYRSLRRDGTAQYLAGTPLADCNHLTVPFATSGVYVTTPQAWWASGGQDERFLGWGMEDFAWLIAHRCFLGAEPVRHEGRVYALHHEAAPKSGPQYEANVQRYRQYLEAGEACDEEALRHLVSKPLDAGDQATDLGELRH